MNCRHGRFPFGVLCAVALTLRVGLAGAEADPGAVLAREARRLRTVAAEVGGQADDTRTMSQQVGMALANTRHTLRDAGIPVGATLGHRGAAHQEIPDNLTALQARVLLENVSTRLDALAALHEPEPAAAAEVGIGFGNVRNALHAELAEDAYAEHQESPFSELIRVATTWAQEKVSNFLRNANLNTLERASYYLMYLIFFVSLGVLGWLIATRYGRRPVAARDASPVVETRRMAEPEAYRAEARAHAAAGRFREAVRALFLMVLAELESVELVAFDRTRTNREYLRQLVRRAGRGPVSTNFAGVMRTYDRTWYGALACSAAEYTDFSREVDGLVAQAKARK